MGGVLCSAIVSEWLKMRKYLGIHYWQDTISAVEVNNNLFFFMKMIYTNKGKTQKIKTCNHQLPKVARGDWEKSKRKK